MTKQSEAMVKPSLGPAAHVMTPNGDGPSDDEILAQCNAALGQVLGSFGCALNARADISPEGRIVTSIQLVRIKR